jgi:type I restriction enzyme S subunit
MEPQGDLILPELLPFIVQSEKFWDWAIKTSSGSLSPRTKFKELSNLLIKLLPIKEQISTLALMLKIEKILSEYFLHIQQLLKFKAILEQKLLADSFDFNVRQDNSFVKLSDFGDFKNGINKDKDSFGSGEPFINLDDVFELDKISEIPKGLVTVTEQDIKNYSVKKGDILFVRSSVKPSGVAKTSLINSNLLNTTYSGFIIRFRPHSYNFQLSEYLNNVFNCAAFKHRISAFVTVSANANINQQALERIKVRIPDFSYMVQCNKIFNEILSSVVELQIKEKKLSLIKKSIISEI